MSAKTWTNKHFTKNFRMKNLKFIFVSGKFYTNLMNSVQSDLMYFEDNIDQGKKIFY